MIHRASVGRSVCPVHCGKTADRIWMPFGIIGQTGSGMRQVVGIGSWEGVFLGANLGTLQRTCATALRRGPLPKLL